MRELARVAQGLFRDDVDCPGDGRRAEEGRAASAHHLYPLNHVGGDLLQAINAREGAEDGARVDQDLGIGAVEAVDAHLLEAAVLAVVLHPDAGLEVQALGQVDGVGRGEDLRVEHVHQRGGEPAGRLVAVGRDHDAIEGDLVFLHLDVQLDGFTLSQLDRLDDRFIAQRLELYLEIALGQVLQEVVAGVVGRRADGRADDDHVDICQVLLGVLIQDMPDQVGVGVVQWLFVRLGPRGREEAAKAHQ